MPVTGKRPDSTSKLFVGGLASTIDEDALRQYFEQWGGEITDVVVMRDPATKRSRGFGFVTFASEEQVDTAMSHRPHAINGKEVDSKRAVPREFQNKTEAQISSKRIYLSGIKPEHTDEMLEEYFSKFGNVSKVDIVVDKNTHERRGFAFVTFDDYDPADKAVLTRSHTIGGRRCDCRKALSKEEMAKVQQQEMDRQARGNRSRGMDNSYGGYEYGGGQQNYGGGYNDYSNGYSRPPASRGSWNAGAQNAGGQYGSGYDYNAGYNSAPASQWGGSQEQYGRSGGAAPNYPSGQQQGWSNPGYGDYNSQSGMSYGSAAYPPAAPAGRGGGYNTNGFNSGAAGGYGAPSKGPQQQSWQGDSGWSAGRNY